MKRCITLCCCLGWWLSGWTQQPGVLPLQQKLQADSSKKSVQAKQATSWGSDSIVIQWYSPAVRGRVIWGGLVPYGDVWVSGAHQATQIVFSCNVKLGDKQVKKGKYALFTIPGRDSWTLILNKNYNQHLTDDYSKEGDVLRLDVQPVILENPVERLEWGFIARDASKGMLYMVWEKLAIGVTVTRAND